MRALVVYESRYGSTHTVALHVADGLRTHFDVGVVPAREASATIVAAADLLVVGGPTHEHLVTRRMGRDAASNGRLPHDPSADGPGLREWFAGLDNGGDKIAAAFDTRVAGSPLFARSASTVIAHRLDRHGFVVVIEPASFLVGKDHHVLPGEAGRAAEWGEALSAAYVLIDSA